MPASVHQPMINNAIELSMEQIAAFCHKWQVTDLLPHRLFKPALADPNP